MNKNRMWIIGSALVMVAVLFLGVLLGIQPQLAAMATADDARTAVEASNAGQATVLANLKSDFEGIDDLKAELMPLDASVPNGTEMSAFVTQLDALAGTTQVTFSGMTVADAQPYVDVVAPTPIVSAEAGSTPTSTPTPVPSDAAAAPATAGAPPVSNSKINPGNFASLAVQITVTGTYANALNFVNGLQTGKRLFLVSGLTTAPLTEAEGTVTATITGLVYVLVPPATAAAPATK